LKGISRNPTRLCRTYSKNVSKSIANNWKLVFKILKSIHLIFCDLFKLFCHIPNLVYQFKNKPIFFSSCLDWNTTLDHWIETNTFLFGFLTLSYTYTFSHKVTSIYFQLPPWPIYNQVKSSTYTYLLEMTKWIGDTFNAVNINIYTTRFIELHLDC